jgi:heme A synthase
LKTDAGAIPLRKLTAATVAAVLIQLVLGAGFRHQAFGIIPHIIGALAVTLLVLSTVTILIRRHNREKYLTGPGRVAAGLLVAQLCIGVAAYLARLASASDPQPLEPMISLTVAHLVVGALTLAAVVVLALRCHQVLVPVSVRTSEGVGAPAHSSTREAAV